MKILIMVYEAGFASSQSAYELGYKKLFDTLDKLENRLSTSGPFLVIVSWKRYRLFCTLVRFDAVYFGHLNVMKQIKDYVACKFS